MFHYLDLDSSCIWVGVDCNLKSRRSSSILEAYYGLSFKSTMASLGEATTFIPLDIELLEAMEKEKKREKHKN